MILSALKKYNLLGLLLHLLYTCNAAAIEYAHFVHFGTSEGLASNKVLCIEPDPEGHLWIATDFGIDRFNGKTFKHYQGDGYPSLKQEFVHNIKYIGDGKIEACGQFNFLQDYDIKTDSFTNVMPQECQEKHVTSVLSTYIAPDGNRYIQTNSMGIYQFNKQTQAYENISADKPEIRNTFIGSLFADRYGNKWVGTLGTVFVYSPSWQLIRSFASPSGQAGAVTNIKYVAEGKIAVTSYTNELWIFSEDNPQQAPRVITLPFNNANGFLLDQSGRVWIGSDGDGLWYTRDIASPTPHFTEVRPYKSTNNELSKLYAMCEDAQGNIWLGTYNRGIWGYMKQQSNFVYSSEQKGFPTNVCTGFHADEGGNLWVTTDGNGLYQVKGDFQQIERYSLPSMNLTALAASGTKGEILLPTWGSGILCFNTQTKQARRLHFGPTLGQGINYTSNATATTGGDLWVCTTGDGLYHRHQGEWSRTVYKGSTNSSSQDLWPKKVIEGKDGTLWVISSNTLWHVNGGKATDLVPDFTKQNSNHPTFVLDAALRPSGDLIVGTTRNMLHVSADGTRTDTLHYLPQAMYSIVLADNEGHIWAGSNEGVLKIDIDAHNYKKMPSGNTNSQRDEFFPMAGYRDEGGRLYFGTNTGFLCYNPAGSYQGSPIAHLAFSDLFIHNAKVKPYSGALQGGALDQQKEITLAHDQTNISIEVDLVDFEELNKAKARYRLLGLHDGWTDMAPGQPITFNHLSKGNYTLQVEAYRANEGAEKAVKTLAITVLPPWWSSWWFRLLALLLVTGTVFLALRQRYRRMKETQELLTRTVNERTRELKSTLAEKNRLISVVAHDLKNPMFAIVSALGSWISKNRCTSNQAQHDPIVEIYNSASLLQNEMQKLLDWVQSDVVAQHLEPAPVNLWTITANVASLLDKQLRMKGLTLTTSCTLQKCALADAKTIEIVLRNLLSNSIKFTPRGGAIEIKLQETTGKAMMEVSDNGTGIDKKLLKKLTEKGPHSSTEGTESEKGTGMGIDLCQTYVARNNGTLHINSKPGVGTSICITLPLTSVPATNTQAPATATATATQPATSFSGTLLEGNTLLLIDDDELIRDTLGETLGKYATIITACNGQEGYEAAKAKQPDMIVSDVSMPVMDGLEMGKALNNDKATRHIPLLFISANNEEEDRIGGLKSGAVDYIVKPFNTTELLFKLNNLLDLRQKLQQNLMEKLMRQQAEPASGAQPTGTQPQKGTETAPEMAPDLKRYMDLLEQHYQNCNLQIDDLAREMCISQSTMSRRIKALIGKTPVELLSQFRLNKAKALLLQCRQEGRDLQIAEIATKVGFSDPSYFTRRFKDYFGITPTQITDK